MAITEKVQFAKMAIGIESGSGSLCIDAIFLKDDIERSREHWGCTYWPGQIEDVKAILGVESSPEIAYLESIWTPEVIAAYEAKQAAAVAEQEPQE